MQFSIDGIEYQAVKVDALKQFHLARRLSPFLEAIVPVIAKVKGGVLDADNPEASFDALLEGYAPFAKMMADMPDDQADYILFGLLACVKRKQPQGLGWANVSSGNALMFQDINVMQMLQMAYHAMTENLADFFPRGVATLSAITQKQSAL
jgi:hypothetical protein